MAVVTKPSMGARKWAGATQVRINAVLAAAVREAGAFSADPKMADTIMKLSTFGGYLESKAALGDLDLAYAAERGDLT